MSKKVMIMEQSFIRLACEAEFDAAITYVKSLFPGLETKTREPGELSTIGISSGISEDGKILLNYGDLMLSEFNFFNRWKAIWFYSAAAEMCKKKGVKFTVAEGTDKLEYNKEKNEITYLDPYLCDLPDTLLPDIELMLETI